MHIGRRYSAREIFFWTLRETVVFVLIPTVLTVAWAVFGQAWLSIPWQPVALVGTAVAFVTSFKNNAAYGRLWEARQIWGSIVNGSRTWAVQVLDMPTSPLDAKKALVYRHIAWLTALRFQLREARGWEHIKTQVENLEYSRRYEVPEWKSELGAELEPLISAAEKTHVLSKKNRATHLLAAQSRTLQELSTKGELTELRFIELERAIAQLYDCQGRAERIKNFPYPRQFATLNTYFIWMLILSLPFALMPELAKLGAHFVWLTIPIASAVSWIFHMIDKIGEASENPFEGGPNDVPISTMARAIEIDLRELLGETPPQPLAALHNIQM